VKEITQLPQRKRTLRAFSGLVGRFEPEPENTRGPGRPRSHVENAAKQKAYRNRHSDTGRRGLIAWILKKSRSTEPNAKYLRNLRDELLTLPRGELQGVVEVLKQNLDAHGRLHNERSGERERLNGMSEIERLLARKNQRENGCQVSVQTPSILKAPQSDEARDAAIRDLLNDISVDRRCPWCNTSFEARTAAENHFNDQYDRGKRQADHVKTLRALDLVPPELLEDAKRRLLEESHYLGINERIQRLRKRHAQWQREGKHNVKSSGSYVDWDLRVW
jgi:hypothetical protein